MIEQLNAKGIPTEQLFIDTGMWDAAMAKDKVDAWLSSSKANEIEMIISVVQLSANLANGKAATEGTKWKLENRVVRIPYVGVDKDNLSEFLK